MENEWRIVCGDAIDALDSVKSKSIQTCICSPPYWNLREYGSENELGHEVTPEEYVEKIVKIFQKVRNTLRNDGTTWIVLGDSYCDGGGYSPSSPSNVFGSMQSTNQGVMAKPRSIPIGCKPKDLVGIPWMVALALRKDGWYLRSDIIWEKLNGMPEPVKDRPNRMHEYIFLLSKKRKYYYDHVAVMEDAVNGKKRNCRSVWHLPKGGARGGKNVGVKKHFAVFPPQLVEKCILSTTKPGDIVLDPFTGSGTTGVVAIAKNRKFLGIEISQEYCDLAETRIRKTEQEKIYI